MNPYIPKQYNVMDVKKETSDTSTFRVNFKSRYMPGQFVMTSLLGIGECPISIASFSNKHVDLCIRNVGNVTNAIHKLKKNSKIFIRGPLGNGYPMEKFLEKNIILIGGGTGVAPLRGVVEYILAKRKKFKNADIFLGYRSPDDILFKRDFKEWKKKFNFYITVDKGDKKWKGNIGVVTKLLEKHKPNNKNSIVVICGPPIMIKFIVQTLKKFGFKDEQIYISLERLMKCGIGKCGHCLIKGKYVCKDGPVFNYKTAKLLED